MAGEVLRYIKKKKWKYKEENSQYVVQICPFCGRKYKFYINSMTGQYICWTCDHTGNLYTLKKELGDTYSVMSPFSDKISTKTIRKSDKKSRIYHKNLLSSLVVRRLLYKKWGYTLKDIIKFQLGLLIDSKKVTWISIPYFENLEIVNIKFRTLPPFKKTFKRIKGMKSSLYNVQNLNYSLNIIRIVEGESDCITASTKFGLENVVGVTVGARGFRPEWKDIIDKFEKVFIIYDPDIVGQDGAHKLACRLGPGRCRNIRIDEDIKDITEWYKIGGRKKEYKKLEKEAKLIDIEDIVSFENVLLELKAKFFLTKTLDDGFETPWKGVNKLIGSMSKGDLIVVSGREKVGKSTFALNILLDFSLKKNIPSLYYCLEMRPERIITKVISNLRFLPRSQITKDDIDVIEAKYRRKPFYMGHSYNFTVDKIFETIRDSVIRYGIEILVFDHLHFLVRSITNVSSEIGNVVRKFKLLAEELKIIVILIAQPKKIQSGKVRMTINDLRDSSSIGQDGDTIIILHRNKLVMPKTAMKKPVSIFSDITEVIVEATRYNPGGITELKFNGELSTYFNSRKEERILINKGIRNAKKVKNIRR